MAEEDKTIEIGEAASAEVTAPALKKERAPRRAKIAPEAKSAPLDIAPIVNQRKKRVANVDLDAKVAVIAKKPIKARAKKAPAAVKSTKALATGPAPVLDDMAELLQLEEENKRLRKTLAEKLREENANLRKRLGLN
ncbi:hypothetical protein [Sinorhizobium sp. RAC02]|uniref:hypothetical protein n=1 Tax=Sinorhizobium sp. RAC02 TaxID=1842534 RepID=UPI00083E1F3D|nr:hypothetical protein [Sinorhizobium sp. RAC02]AOF92844.1 putative transcriptional regulator syrB2 [Sinorhizobium sp. RAC02]